MPAFKIPTFQDRNAAAATAKQKALDQLKARPPIDETVMAERRQAGEARERVIAEERAAKAIADAQKKAERSAAKAIEIENAEAAAALKTARLTPATAADMKAARDARFAARKARQ